MEDNAIASHRVISVDLLRGIIMIIMVLDHVRDFFHISAQAADPLDLSTTTTAFFLPDGSHTSVRLFLFFFLEFQPSYQVEIKQIIN
ncbi:MAG: hypothetical protein NVS9B7_05450 [Flavisolibacter sp.]